MKNGNAHVFIRTDETALLGEAEGGGAEGDAFPKSGRGFQPRFLD